MIRARKGIIVVGGEGRSDIFYYVLGSEKK